MRIWISAGFLAIALAGCGSSPPPPEKEQKPQPTVFDDDLKAIDRAKAAEAQVEDRVNDLNKQLDKQENGDATSPDADTPKN
jgi:PBP1b-binding outer membrane lipoprotein LpoB